MNVEPQFKNQIVFLNIFYRANNYLIIIITSIYRAVINSREFIVIIRFLYCAEKNRRLNLIIDN